MRTKGLDEWSCKYAVRLCLILSAFSARHPPGRAIRPGFQCSLGPLGRFVGVAHVAGVWNLQRLRICRRDEVKGVTSNLLIRDGLRDFGHVAADALVARAARLVMGMRFDAGCVRPGLGIRTMAVEAQRI